MPNLGRRITFIELLDICDRIEVPQLQRDYAQGRESAKEVRNGFLDALGDALLRPRDDATLPLNLDFVYGSMEGENGKSFLPLDGQQRLTTLFLLHWYLAWRDGALDTFQDRMRRNGHSRFSYAVRPSSKEFFDELVRFVPPQTPEQVESVRSLMENQHWFYLYWRLDPTIQSSLTMLDAMHERFSHQAGLFERILDNVKPAITFQMLPLEHFGLSDDLYIKMNARGKPLTQFETFKARFEQILTELYPTETRRIGNVSLPVHDFFSRRMDTAWSDFFWSHRAAGTTVFDKEAMNLFWIVAWVSIDAENRDKSIPVSTYRQTVGGYNTFLELGLLTKTFADNLIGVLEAWSTYAGTLTSQLPDRHYFDEKALFLKASQSPHSTRYGELLLFAAFVSFLRENEDDLDPTEFLQWMRVVFNLVENSDIERPHDYERCLSGIAKLLPHSRRILEHLATMEPTALGFSRDQVQEEMLKSKLLLAHPDWAERIHAAEAHEYFRGQIGFLLSFSGVSPQAEEQPVEDWAPEGHAQLQSKFDEYFGKAELTFNENGLVPISGEPYQWERSLLAIGNYLIKVNRNLSFLTSPATNYDSWKRFLRGGVYATARQHLKTLWDRIDLSADLGSQLAEIRTESDLEPWRAAMVAHPQAMAYCGENEMRWENGSQEIYLLKRKQMNGAHAELFSYVLYAELSKKESREKLLPLTLAEYQYVSMTETEPYVLLSLCSPLKVRVSIESEDEKFLTKVMISQPEEVPGAVDLLTGDLGFTSGGNAYSCRVGRDQIHEVLYKLAGKLAETMKE